MSQTYDDFSRSFCILCSDVGLNCDCVIFGNRVENVVDRTISHMFEYHAINPEEITSEMMWKIRNNVHESRTRQIVVEYPELK